MESTDVAIVRWLECWHRALTWQLKGELDKAIADYSQAVRLNQNYAAAYFNRATVWELKRELEHAKTDYDEVIRVDPTNAFAHNNRGRIRESEREYRLALADYNEAIGLDPDCRFAHKNRAWLLATCPDNNIRSGGKAVDDATRSCEMADWRSHDDLSILAAAYAESGEFDRAVQWQEKAIVLAPDARMEDYRARLRLFQDGKPYRDEGAGPSGTSDE